MSSPPKCCIKTCGNKSSNNLFKAPSDPEMHKKWEKAVGRKFVKRTFYVCENHFKEKDVQIEKILSDDAIPELHLTAEDDIKLEGKCCGVCLKEMSISEAMTVGCRIIFKEITGYQVS
jgi:THAP domain